MPGLVYVFSSPTTPPCLRTDDEELRVNADSMTLFLTNGKVHIESMVCMSEKLLNKIEAELAKK